MISVHVECYSGRTYAQEPRAIVWRGFRVPIAAIENMWRTPDGPLFRVRLDDDAIVDLQYVEASDEWLLTDRLLPRR
ncbi:MAG TPA: hypothetical protein VJ793_07720 [Anaerolineae bacterium]|nr:hypothetical protein [Anaerolineae bacterium]